MSVKTLLLMLRISNHECPALNGTSLIRPLARFRSHCTTERERGEGRGRGKEGKEEGFNFQRTGKSAMKYYLLDKAWLLCSQTHSFHGYLHRTCPT